MILEEKIRTPSADSAFLIATRVYTLVGMYTLVSRARNEPHFSHVVRFVLISHMPVRGRGIRAYIDNRVVVSPRS